MECLRLFLLFVSLLVSAEEGTPQWWSSGKGGDVVACRGFRVCGGTGQCRLGGEAVPGSQLGQITACPKARQRV